MTPEVRFSGFNDDWEQLRLGEISEIKTGPFGSTLHAEDYVEDGFPIITTEHFKNGELPESKNNVPQVSTEDYNRLKSYILNEEDIVFSRVGSVDINALVSKSQSRWLFSGRVLRVRSNNVIDSQYLHYELSTTRVKNDVVSRAVGQTMPSINTEILKATSIYLPKFTDEQCKIGVFFKQLDNTITLHHRKLELLKQLKKAYLQQMFPTNGEKNPKVRFANFTNVWELRKVREIFKVTRGQVLAVTETNEEKSDITPFPVYSSQTKNNGLMGYYKDYLFDTAITWTTDGANAGTVSYRNGKFYSTNVNGVLLSDKGYTNKAIAEILNLEAWKWVSHVGNPKLMNNVMGDISIAIPKSLEEQDRLSKFFNQLDDTITLHQNKIETIKKIKKAFLQKMFI